MISEIRRSGDHLAVHDREVERDVMPFDAPAPGLILAGLAEEGDVVEPGLAMVTSLDLSQNQFDLVHD